MAVTLQCPRCEHKQRIDNDKVGTEVHCKICHHLISSPPTDDDAQAGIKPGTPTTSTATRAVPPDLNAAPKAKKKRWDDEEDDDERSARPRRRAKETTSSAMPLILLGVGALVVLMFACGGVGFALIFVMGDHAVAERPAEPIPMIAVADNAAIVVAQPMQPPQPMPGPPPFVRPPGPNGNPVPFENRDPNDRKQIDRVLAILKGPANERAVAWNWLRDADANHPRRAEVARQLEAMVDAELRLPRGFNNPFFAAYFRWVTAENVPSLLRLAQNNALNPDDNDRRRKSMLALAQLKEPRGAEIIAAGLGNPFDGNTPQSALQRMGPIAEKAVLKYYNHPDNRARDQARGLIQGYQTQPGVILTQCLADLDSSDKGRRNAAVKWFASTPATPERRDEVARSLAKNLATVNFFFERDLAKALGAWGTSECVPVLVQRIETNKTGNDEAIRILGKIGDPRGVKAVAKSMGNLLNERAAKEALKEVGPKLAEPAVLEALAATNDMVARGRYVAFLGEIGTSARSGPALTQLAMQFPQDFFLNTAIKNARAAIQARGQ